ncbi:MAG: DUF456 family protein [Thermodesulfobacteriota bacterium]
MEIFILVLFLLFSAAAIVSHFFGLPGNWVILIFSFFLAWTGDFDKIPITTLIILLALSLLGEAIEFLLGIVGAKKYETSNRAIAGSIIFGIIGAIAGAPFFFGIGSVVGAFAGAFAGAVLVEIILGKSLNQSVTAGWGTLLGRVGGSFAKIFIGVVMIVITLTSFFKN